MKDCGANVSCSHMFYQFFSYPRPLLLALLFVPLGLPKAVRGEVVEYERGRWENKWFLGHGAVGDEMCILPGEAKHSCCGLASDAIQKQTDILESD